MEEEKKKPSRSQTFVAAVLKRCECDRAFAANLRRADNPDTEHYAYGPLAAFGIALERDGERRPFALIGAGLSRSKAARDGSLGLGEALRRCVADIIVFLAVMLVLTAWKKIRRSIQTKKAQSCA